MRIKENFHEDFESYSCEIRQRVVEVFHYTSRTAEMKRLLSEIRKEAAGLRRLFPTEEERKERQEAVSFFDARMQATVFYTLKNLEGYQKCGWRKLIYEGDSRDESASPV